MDVMMTAHGALEQATPLAAIGLFEGETAPELIASLFETADFTGRSKQTLLLYTRDGAAARRVLLLGLGKREKLTPDLQRELAAIAVQRAAELRLPSCTVDLRAADAPAVQAIAEGALLGAYRYQRYQTGLTDADRHQLDRIAICGGDDPVLTAAVATGAAIARGATLARDLANTPSNDLTPAKLADAAAALTIHSRLVITVLDAQQLAEQRFGGLLGVGQGSVNPPRFIIMEHGAPQPGQPTLCLVGKGITFDSGGISIKPAESMELMKMDMGGAAAVIGAMQAIAELDLPTHVVGLIAAAENMPSGSAFKPGDVLTTLSGKTIEIINTDAEGRVVLADALFYAQRYAPAAIVDLATLTGAIMVALGPHAIGVMSNSDELAARIVRAGDLSGERAWQLPLWDGYREAMRSEIADVKSAGIRYGGAINAAAFLEHFVGDCHWAHLDIAGTAWTDARPKAYTPRGATGVGVRLLVQFVQSYLV